MINLNTYEILKRPILSEKSVDARELNQYTFAIHHKSGKQDVAKAVASFFDVKVESVRTITTRGKIKRRGAHLSKPKLRKKAIVTLAKGQTLPMFEDQ